MEYACTYRISKLSYSFEEIANYIIVIVNSGFLLSSIYVHLDS